MTSADARIAIETAGGRYLGVQDTPSAASPLHLFQDPATRTTLALAEGDISVATVKARLRRARQMFARPIGEYEAGR